MRRRHRLLPFALSILAAAAGCEESKKSPPAATTPPVAATPVPATPVAAAAADAAPAVPALPALPAGADPAKAAACSKGEAAACAALAGSLRDDSPEQRAVLERGCDLGELGCCGDLGWSLSTTGNSLANRKRGLVLMEKACRGNGVGAAREPGLFCEQAIVFLNGLGREDRAFRDRAKEKELLALKCQQSESKLDCPCSKDEDCGGDGAFCQDGACDMMSPD